MKILVTGGAGFIGSHTTKQLLDGGHKAIVYDNLSRGFKDLVDPRAEFVLGDVSEKEKLKKALSGVDAVIHMAAFIIVPESVRKPDLYYQNNVLGTKVLLGAMEEVNVKKIIFSSSATVYGDPLELPLNEESEIKKPANPYGQNKLDMERLCKDFGEKTGSDVIILRYFNPYGPGEKHSPETHAVPNFIKSTLAKQPIPLYWKGEQIRDFIYVEDLSRAHIAAVTANEYKIYNIGTEVGTKVIDVVNLIFKIVGYTVPINDLGERAGDVPALYTSSEKIQKDFGWRPRFSLHEGLKKTIEYFQTAT
ncbi:MAG: UDP-glucose 4-epimerase GalE [Candidatus Woykebacteria bacterium RBG_16_39_9b]|uniref:UDP-glucose 4-epimerase n=1 Tax=Candidatus Woykebacteria bacterium RBG_16_39_9b TaxID=1802595 RepID=A0A1G1WB44_9BACT|nr:MAG: UDP-glucose 4-epimerase GalE [Candidatus Woykebacteria bacterium RBG_16_39_9b]